MYDTPKYSYNQVKQIMIEVLENTWYFDSDRFITNYLINYNNWPSPEQEVRAREKFVEDNIN